MREIEAEADGPEKERRLSAMLNNLSIAYGDLGDVVRERELLERALGIVERAYGPDHPRVGFRRHRLARKKGAG